MRVEGGVRSLVWGTQSYFSVYRETTTWMSTYYQTLHESKLVLNTFGFPDLFNYQRHMSSLVSMWSALHDKRFSASYCTTLKLTNQQVDSVLKALSDV